MPAVENQVVDASGRVLLPESFAESTVTVMRISEDEVRICRTSGGTNGDVLFPEETVTVLSNRDRELLLDLLENPPPPTQALIDAFEKYAKNMG